MASGFNVTYAKPKRNHVKSIKHDWRNSGCKIHGQSDKHGTIARHGQTGEKTFYILAKDCKVAELLAVHWA